MPIEAYFTRPLNREWLIEPAKQPVVVASLGPLPAGSYVVFAKVVVVTRVDEHGQDSARAEFILKGEFPHSTTVDTAMCTLWHSSDKASLQPADTVSLQLPVRLPAVALRKVSLYCKSKLGILELRDIVITAIRVDKITDMSGS